MDENRLVRRYWCVLAREACEIGLKSQGLATMHCLYGRLTKIKLPYKAVKVVVFEILR